MWKTGQYLSCNFSDGNVLFVKELRLISNSEYNYSFSNVGHIWCVFFYVLFWKAIVPIHCNWVEMSIFQFLLFCLMEEWMSYLFENMHWWINDDNIFRFAFQRYSFHMQKKKKWENHKIIITFPDSIYCLLLLYLSFCIHSLKLSLLHSSAFAVRAQRGHMPLCIDWCSCRQCPANQKCLENFKHFPFSESIWLHLALSVLLNFSSSLQQWIISLN